MSVLEIALAIVLIWALACCSLLLGGCVSICALRRDDALTLSSSSYRSIALFVRRESPPHYAQKSELYLD